VLYAGIPFHLTRPVTESDQLYAVVACHPGYRLSTLENKSAVGQCPEAQALLWRHSVVMSRQSTPGRVRD
jgi:hypothetical protein